MTSQDRTFVKELQVTGQNLVQRIRELVQDSNTRRVTIFSQDGSELLSIPLTFGVVAGSFMTMSAPALAGLGALAAMVTHVRLEVTRTAHLRTASPAAPARP